MTRYIKAIWFISTAFTLTLLAFLSICFMRLLNLLKLPVNHTEYAHQVATYWGQSMFFLTPGWNIKVYGDENLPAKGHPVIYVANHQSNADIWAVYFLKRRFSWLSKAEVFKIPMVGQSMRWAKYISIDRGNKQSHRKAMRDSVGLLRDGISMFFFPEGTRSKDMRIKDFKPGAFRLAKEANVDIQPLIIKGTGDLLEKGSIVPSGYASVELHILPVISSEGKTAQELCIESRNTIVQQYNKIDPDHTSQLTKLIEESAT
jgi:1-acyl-sn-glycerol-3-phosphate acyltransferase